MAAAPLMLAIQGVCPRCGSRTLFAAPARIAERCRACGLDYQSFTAGERPLALLTMLVAVLLMLLAVALDDAFSPPLLLHVLWMPITAAVVVAVLRLTRGVLLARRYRRAVLQDVRP